MEEHKKGRVWKYALAGIGTALTVIAAYCIVRAVVPDVFFADVPEEVCPYTPISESLARNVKKYASLGEFHDGLAIVGTANKRHGVIDINGNEIIPCTHERLEYAGNGYFFTIKNKRRKEVMGLLDSHGRELIPCDRYMRMHLYPDIGLISLSILSEIGSTRALTDFNGRILHKNNILDEPDVYIPSEGLVCTPGSVVNHKNVWNYTDYSGKTVLTYTSCLTPFYKGMAMVYDRAIIDKNGNELYKIRKEGGKVGLYDSQGRALLPCKYDRIGNYKGGFLFVGANRMSGVYDLVNKREVLPPIYSHIRAVEGKDGGVALFVVEKTDDNIGACDTEGKQVIPFLNGCRLDETYPEYGVISFYKRCGEYGPFKRKYFNFEGKLLWDETEHEADTKFGEGYLKCETVVHHPEAQRKLEKVLERMESGKLTREQALEELEGIKDETPETYIIDTEGETVGKIEEYTPYAVHEGHIATRHKLFTIYGKQVKPDLGDDAEISFYDYGMSSGLIVIKYNGEEGYMNRKGETTFGKLSKH